MPLKQLCDGRTDGPTDRPTDQRNEKWLIESRSTRLKRQREKREEERQRRSEKKKKREKDGGQPDVNIFDRVTKQKASGFSFFY